MYVQVPCSCIVGCIALRGGCYRCCTVRYIAVSGEVTVVVRCCGADLDCFGTVLCQISELAGKGLRYRAESSCSAVGFDIAEVGYTVGIQVNRNVYIFCNGIAAIGYYDIDIDRFIGNSNGISALCNDNIGPLYYRGGVI